MWKYLNNDKPLIYVRHDKVSERQVSTALAPSCGDKDQNTVILRGR